MRRVFRFEGSWVVAAPLDRVAATLADLEFYPRWWPEVVAVASLGPDDARVLCRSRLPYTLDLVLHAESRTPPTLSVSVEGDLRGRIAWLLAPADGATAAHTRLRLDQEVTVSGPALGLLAWVAAPLLRWNHEQMMASGIAGLRRHLTV